jgi:hypothetical protein
MKQFSTVIKYNINGNYKSHQQCVIPPLLVTDAEFEVCSQALCKMPKHCIHAVLIVYAMPYMIGGLH